MKRGTILLAGLLIALVVILVVRTVAFQSKQVSPESVESSPVDSHAVATRLSEGLRHRTISHSLDGPVEAQAFLDLHAQLARDYPRPHASLTRETVSDFSLLYTWPGSKPDMPAVLLLAHQDVVPVEAGSEDAWEQPPFSGHMDGTFVWGRGAMDD